MNKPLINNRDPLQGESMSHYIQSLTIKNRYLSKNYIERLLFINEKRELKEINPDIYYLYNQLNILSALTKVKIEDLYNCTAHKYAKYFCTAEEIYEIDGLSFANNVKQLHIINNNAYKICPACLKENNYLRLHWSLTPITVCLKHNLSLVDKCDKCGVKINLSDFIGNEHKCGQKLSNITSESILDDKETIEVQTYIQSILGIYNKEITTISSLGYGLGPQKFFLVIDALIILLVKTNYLQEFDGEDNKDIPGRLSSYKISKNSTNKNLNRLVNRAYKILEDFPNEFAKILRLLKSRMTYLQNVYLLIDLNDCQFKFIKDTIQQYLLAEWDNGKDTYSSKFFRANEKLLCYRKYIPANEAQEILNIGKRELQSLLSNNLLNFRVNSGNKRKVYQIEKESVDRVLLSWTNKITIENAAKRLNIDVYNVMELIKTKLISGSETVPRTSIILIEEQNYLEFENMFLKRPKINLLSNSDLVSLDEAIRILGFKNWALSGILKMVKDGQFRTYVNENEKGLKSICLIRNELIEYCSIVSIISKKPKKTSYISLSKIRKIMGVNYYTVLNWVKNGLLKIYKEQYLGSVTGKYVLISDFIHFYREYIFINDASSLLGVKPEIILNWLKKGLMRTYSGIEIDGTRRCLFKKTELEKFLPQNRVSIEEASKILITSKNNILRLIKRHELNPIQVNMKGTNEYILLLDDLEQYKEKMNKEELYLFSKKEVAEYLEVSLSITYRWVKQGILTPIYDPGRKKDKYKKVEVDIIRKDLENKYLNLKRVRNNAYNFDRLMDVHVQKIYELMKKGKCRIRKLGKIEKPKSYRLKNTRRITRKTFYKKVLCLNEVCYILDECRDCIKKRIDTGILKVADSRSHKTVNYYFYRKDVARVIKYENSIVSTADISKTYNVLPSTVLKWITKGILNPISGPTIDGNREYLFLKEYVYSVLNL